MGEWVPLEGDFFWSEDEETDDYLIRVSSAEVLPYEEFMERFGKPSDYLAESSQHDVILLKIDFKNNGENQGGIFIRDSNLLNQYFSAYYDKSEEYMKIANPNYSSGMTGISVKPHTDSSMWYVYTTSGRADAITYLDELSGQDRTKMFLIVSMYPVKKLIQLDLDLSSLQHGTNRP